MKYKDVRPVLELMRVHIKVVDLDEDLEQLRKHLQRFEPTSKEVLFRQYLDRKKVGSIEIVTEGDFFSALVTVYTEYGVTDL